MVDARIECVRHVHPSFSCGSTMRREGLQLRSNVAFLGPRSRPFRPPSLCRSGNQHFALLQWYRLTRSRIPRAPLTSRRRLDAMKPPNVLLVLRFRYAHPLVHLSGLGTDMFHQTRKYGWCSEWSREVDIDMNRRVGHLRRRDLLSELTSCLDPIYGVQCD